MRDLPHIGKKTSHSKIKLGMKIAPPPQAVPGNIILKIDKEIENTIRVWQQGKVQQR